MRLSKISFGKEEIDMFDWNDYLSLMAMGPFKAAASAAVIL
jgi:hypothetical protein